MSKQSVPTWEMLGLEGPPPVVRGYHDYGVVYDPERDGRPTLLANLREDARWGLWSWHYWGRKVRKDIENAPQRPRGASVMLALVWLTDTLYQRLIVRSQG